MRIITLDLLRLAAALAVVFFHYFAGNSAPVDDWLKQVAQFGYLGVPLFFLISGYVISLSAENRSAFQFTWSRFLRLYPMYWTGILFTLLMLYLLSGQVFSFTQIAANLTMANDYLNIDDIDGVYWTLHAELKFYACVFILLFTGVFRFFRVWISLWLLITASYAVWQQPSVMGWFISPFYSPLFIAGVCFYLIHTKRHLRFAWSATAISLLVALWHAWPIAKGFLYDASTHSLIIVMLFHLAIYGLFALIAVNKLHINAQPWMYRAGALTYPLYLVHNQVGKALIAQLNEYIPYTLAAMLTTMFVLLAAYVIDIFVEQYMVKPLKQLGKRLFPRALGRGLSPQTR